MAHFNHFLKSNKDYFFIKKNIHLSIIIQSLRIISVGEAVIAKLLGLQRSILALAAQSMAWVRQLSHHLKTAKGKTQRESEKSGIWFVRLGLGRREGLNYLVKWLKVEKEAVKRRTRSAKIINGALPYHSLQAFWNRSFQSLHQILLHCRYTTTTSTSSTAETKQEGELKLCFLSLSFHFAYHTTCRFETRLCGPPGGRFS